MKRKLLLSGVIAGALALLLTGCFIPVTPEDREASEFTEKVATFAEQQEVYNDVKTSFEGKFLSKNTTTTSICVTWLPERDPEDMVQKLRELRDYITENKPDIEDYSFRLSTEIGEKCDSTHNDDFRFGDDVTDEKTLEALIVQHKLSIVFPDPWIVSISTEDTAKPLGVSLLNYNLKDPNVNVAYETLTILKNEKILPEKLNWSLSLLQKVKTAPKLEVYGTGTLNEFKETQEMLNKIATIVDSVEGNLSYESAQEKYKLTLFLQDENQISTLKEGFSKLPYEGKWYLKDKESFRPLGEGSFAGN